MTCPRCKRPGAERMRTGQHQSFTTCEDCGFSYTLDWTHTDEKMLRTLDDDQWPRNALTLDLDDGWANADA